MFSSVRHLVLLSTPLALLALACDSSGQGPHGTGGSSGTGGAGGGGGQGGEGTALFDCNRAWGNDNTLYVVAYANPAEFSVNSETGARDQHTAIISLADWAASRTSYTTTGSADHRHEFSVSDAQREDLRLNMPIVATTGPPVGAAAGHTHTVMFQSCGVPGG